MAVAARRSHFNNIFWENVFHSVGCHPQWSFKHELIEIDRNNSKQTAHRLKMIRYVTMDLFVFVSGVSGTAARPSLSHHLAAPSLAEDQSDPAPKPRAARDQQRRRINPSFYREKTTFSITIKPCHKRDATVTSFTLFLLQCVAMCVCCQWAGIEH